MKHGSFRVQEDQLHMTEFRQFDGTFRIDGYIDWNNLLDHGLEKPARFIIRINDDGDYEIIYGYGQNQAGKVAYTNDTPDMGATLNQLNTLLPTGGKAFIKKGTYLFTTNATLSNNGIILIGEGQNRNGTHGTTIFKQADGADLTGYLLTCTGYNIELHDIFFDGNKNNNSSTLSGISFSSSDGAIKDCAFMLFSYNGIYVNAHAVWFANVASEGNGAAGVVGGSALDDSLFVHLHCETNGGYGTHLQASYNNRFVGCKWSINSKAGLLLEYANCKKNIFSACHWRKNSWHGIWLIGASDNRFDGNVANNSQATDNTYDGVYLSSSGANHSLRNTFALNILCDLTNKHKYSIHEEDVNQDYNIFHDSIVDGAKTKDILKQGANSKICDTWELNNQNGNAAAWHDVT